MTITYSRIAKVAIPIVLSNITIPLLGLVDTAVIGRLGEAKLLAAVSLGSIIVSFIYWTFGFLRMGTTGLTAQAKGRGDEVEITSILIRGLIVGLLGGLILMIFQAPIIWICLQMFQASTVVESTAEAYWFIRIFGAPFCISNFVLIGWLVALERTKLILVLQVVINLINIFLDLWFVSLLNWGVEGVAFASVVSEIVGFFLALIFCQRQLGSNLIFKHSSIFSLIEWKKMFSVNIYILIRSLLLELVVVSYVFFGSLLGTVTLAANQILLQLMSFTAYLLDGLAFSAEVLVGYAVGEKSTRNIRESTIKIFKLAGISALVICLFLIVWGEKIVDFITLDFQVQSVAKTYLFWMIFTPITGFPSWILDGVFIGATQSRLMMKAMFQSVIFYFLIVVLCFPILNNHIIWLLVNIFLLTRAVFLFRYYPRLEKLDYY